MDEEAAEKTLFKVSEVGGGASQKVQDFHELQKLTKMTTLPQAVIKI